MQPRRLLPRPRHVLRITPAILVHPLRGQLQHTVREGRQEVAVVGDEEHGAFEVGQGGDQHFLGGHVQVVGGLVQHQQVGRIKQHLGHDQPRLLAAGQHAAGLFDIVAREAEAARQGAQGALARLGEGAVQRLEDRLLAVQQVHGVLGEIAHPDAGADADRALVGLGVAGHQLQQGRLAGAVGAQDAPALLAAHQEVEAGIDRLGRHSPCGRPCAG